MTNFEKELGTITVGKRIRNNTRATHQYDPKDRSTWPILDEIEIPVRNDIGRPSATTSPKCCNSGCDNYAQNMTGGTNPRTREQCGTCHNLMILFKRQLPSMKAVFAENAGYEPTPEGIKEYEFWKEFLTLEELIKYVISELDGSYDLFDIPKEYLTKVQNLIQYGMSARKPKESGKLW